MLILLSPAKSLDYQSPLPEVPHTQPLFVKQSAELIALLRAKSPQQIASLMQNISASARQQVAVSGSISGSMQVLREISVQTSESTTGMSQSIARLADLSTQLRQSVAGFQLPATETPATRALARAAALARG